MSSSDLIASPTLAHLYIAQGHSRRAREILDDVLRRNPKDGHAIHLRQRLDIVETGEITVQLKGGRLRASWKRARSPEGCAVVLYALRLAADGLHTWVTSQPISAGLGTLEFPVPFPRGAATVSLGRLVRGTGFVPECVGDPLVWTEDTA